MATYVIIRDDSNGKLQCRSASWSSARDGTGSMTGPSQYYDTSTTWITNTEEWSISQVFVAFDTSVIDASETIVSSAYRFYASTASANSSWSLRIRDKTDWTHASLSTSDFVAGANLTSIPLIRSHTMPEQLVSGSVSTIDVNGYTKLHLSTSLQESSTAPAQGVNTFSSGGSGWETRYRLVVHTVQPSTLMGVADAAVQLSDGSTVYLESDGASIPTVTLKYVTTGGVISTIETVPTDPLETHAFKAQGGFQNITLLCDANDNLHVLGARGNSSVNVGRFTWPNTGSGTWGARQGVNTTNSGVTNPINFSAVWCDSLANGGLGRVLLVYSSGDDGTYGYILFDGSTSGGLNVTDSGTSPSWLVSSADYRNIAGSNLSLATDVFGGTRVCSFAYSDDSITSTSSTVTRAFRWGAFTIGSSITNIAAGTTNDPPSNVYSPSSEVNRVIGVGVNKWAIVYNESSNPGQYTNIDIIENATRTNSGFSTTNSLYTVVYDSNTGTIWIYYFDSTDDTKLMRRSYSVATNTFGAAVEVGTFADAGTRNFIRTVKHLRDPKYIEIHWNRTA